MSSQNIRDFISFLKTPDMALPDEEVFDKEFIISDSTGNEYTKVLSVYQSEGKICVDVE